jgi:hypothetical protein
MLSTCNDSFVVDIIDDLEEHTTNPANPFYLIAAISGFLSENT